MTKSLPTFHVTLAADLFSFFVPLLQQGVFVSAKAGGNIKSFLCERLGISPEYAEKRIQTVFADGQVVDDWNRTVLANGSTLALSAAAPGLAGAILRRQGPLSTMRRPITYELEKGPCGAIEGMITLKLFNLLVAELGPLVLEKGILLPGKDLDFFFRELPDDFWAKCREARVDGKVVHCESLREIGEFSRAPFLGLTVRFTGK